MSGNEESPASALYRLAHAGDLAAQVELAQQLMDLGAGDPGVLMVAEAWCCEQMKQNEIVGAYGIGQVRWKRGRLADRDGKLEEAIHHFATATAMLDGLVDEGDERASGLLEHHLELLDARGLKAAVVTEAKRLKREAMSRGD